MNRNYLLYIWALAVIMRIVLGVMGFAADIDSIREDVQHLGMWGMLALIWGRLGDIERRLTNGKSSQ